MFRRKPPPAPPPLAAVMGAGARYSGDLTFEGRVRVDGHFTGRIYTEDLLEVGVEGVIEGEADVARAVVAGRVQGRLRAREHLRLTRTGRVEGALDAGLLEVEPGGRIDAQVKLRGEELP